MIAVLGVDPGVNGGLACLREDGEVLQVWPLNPAMTETDVVAVCAAAAGLLRAHESRMCFFEKVQHMTGDGGKGSHTFGYIKGLLRGALLAHGVILCDVYPMAWQGAMGCLTGGNKNVSKAAAQALFPGVKITHATADALLIAEYGRRRTLDL